VEGVDGIVDVHNNFQSTMVLKSDGTVWVWGQEPKSGLGDGVHTESSVPIQLPGLSGIRMISGRYFLRFAVREDGTVWYWGILDWDQDHNPIVQSVPAQVPGITDAVDVAAHWEALIRTASGELYVFETETLKLTKVPGF
jgi:alpha-tubulin suppressor-like RCC1 family protein